MAKRGLGKGIGSLIQDYSLDNSVSVQHAADKDDEGRLVVMLSVHKIESNPGQPRKHFEEKAMKELADSIKEQGVLQPVIVEEAADAPGRFLIVAGERRFRAAKMANLDQVPALIRNFTEEQRLEVALIENIQREGLNPVEEAQAYKFLIEQAGLNQEELAKKLGKNRSTIANSLRLLQLKDDMQEALIKGVLSAGHARAILSVANPAEQQILYERIMKNSLSVRQAEQAAKELNEGSRAGSGIKKKRKQLEKSIEVRNVEEKFLGALGTKVVVRGSLKKGKLEISYYSPEDLERVFQLIGGQRSLFNQDE